MTPTVAITGSTGLIGRRLCLHLAERGWNVRPLARRRISGLHGESPERSFACNLPDQLDETAFDGADVVIHAAYMTRFTTLSEAQAVNERGTQRVLEAARRCDVKRLVFISSLSAMAEGPSYYVRSKSACERMLDQGRDLVIRPGLVLAKEGGLFQRIVSVVRRSPVVPLVGGGHEIMQTIHIDDLCVGVTRALEQGLTGTLQLAEPTGLPFRDLLRATATHVGRTTMIPLPVPYSVLLFALRCLECVPLNLPVSSENLLGLKAVRQVAVDDDLLRVGLQVRNALQSIEQLLSNQQHTFRTTDSPRAA